MSRARGTSPGQPSPRRGLSRRRFMQGVGTGLGLLPLLQSLPAHAQQGPAPTRLLLLFNPNGTVLDSFWPTVNGLPVTGDTRLSNAQLGPILQPLEAFKDRMLLLDGLNIAVTAKGPGGPHQKGMGGLYTGNILQVGEMADGDGQRAGWADGISVDQEVVRRLDPPTLLPSLELGVRATAADVRSRMIYTGPAAAVPPLNDPRDVFQRLATGFRASDLASTETGAREQRRLVLQAVQRQYETLKTRISREDREKLERHAEFVNGVARRLDYGIGNNPACVEPTEPPTLEFNGETQMPDVVRLQLDLLATAFICDITRVASLQFSSAINAIRFPWLESLVEGHDLSHRGNSDTEAQRQLTERAAWYSEQVAYLLRRLDEVPEGDGSVLDHTLIVWGNELSVGNTHSHVGIPFVLLGGASGRIDTGRYVKSAGIPHNRLLVTVLNAMGVDDQSFGDPDFGGGGPISGVLRG